MPGAGCGDDRRFVSCQMRDGRLPGLGKARRNRGGLDGDPQLSILLERTRRGDGKHGGERWMGIQGKGHEDMAGCQNESSLNANRFKERGVERGHVIAVAHRRGEQISRILNFIQILSALPPAKDGSFA